MSNMNAPKAQNGSAMLEALISLLIISFGVMGFVGMQNQTTVLQIEAYQRAQALIIVNDMAQRMTLNQAGAASYVGSNVGTTAPSDCTTMTTTATKDLCEWSLLIRGEGEKSGTAAVGAMIGARGCVTSPAANQYVITVAWQGMQATGAPASVCGKDAYSAESMRRAVTTVVRVATL